MNEMNEIMVTIKLSDLINLQTLANCYKYEKEEKGKLEKRNFELLDKIEQLMKKESKGI